MVDLVGAGREEKSETLGAAERDELVRLRRENKQLRLERDILWLPGSLARPERSRPGLRVHERVFPIATMARVHGVSEANCHAWRHRPPSAHAVADATLLKRVRTVHATSRATVWSATRAYAAPG
ncbi:MAG TPA: hypothetical protein VHT74_33645 [Acetobacteraceae bacterium]|jgi:hypothetical protein|nr:hypothetical protein [Acetobacteraceae bacterium]